jgi:hypothetical protein
VLHKNAHGMMVIIMRALGKKSVRRTTSLNNKGMEIFEEFLNVHCIQGTEGSA